MANPIVQKSLSDNGERSPLSVAEAFPFIHNYTSEKGIESGQLDRQFLYDTLASLDPGFAAIYRARAEPCIDELLGLGGDVILRGGAIRDTLLKIRAPYDLDLIGTSLAHADTLSIIKKYGNVLIDDAKRNVVTFDLGGIHGDIKSLAVGSDLTAEMMLSQSDFSINSTGYSFKEGRLSSQKGGLQALAERNIQMTSEEKIPKRLINIVRGIRFAVDLNGNIDEQTRLAMSANKDIFIGTESFALDFAGEINKCKDRAKFNQIWLSL